MSHQDRVFFSTFAGIMLFLVVLAFVFFFVASGIVGSESGGQASVLAVQSRIAPVGEVYVAGINEPPAQQLAQAPAQPQAAAAAPAATGAGRDGAQIVQTYCAACHTAGVAGAPKIGDQAAWETRLQAQGIDGLVKSAITGLRAMPPKGTCADCSEAEMKAAIEKMLTDSSLQP